MRIFPKEKPELGSSFCFYSSSSFFLLINRAPVDPTRVNAMPARDSIPVFTFLPACFAGLASARLFFNGLSS